MDTRAVAENLGTTPRMLRRFLRSDQSTFTAVGSGARYDFTSSDLTALAPRFRAWLGHDAPVPVATPVGTPADDDPRMSQSDKDRAVWDEEGDVFLADIRQPAIRARVRQIADERERRLNEQLLAAGLHITQMTKAG
jgi:hypothetical protein